MAWLSLRIPVTISGHSITARIAVAPKETYAVERRPAKRRWAADRTRHQIAVGKRAILERALFEVGSTKIAPFKVCTYELRHEERAPVKVASNESSVDDRTTVESRAFGNKVVVAFVANGLIGTIEHKCRLQVR